VAQGLVGDNRSETETKEGVVSPHDIISLNLTIISPCIVNIFAEHNQQDATFLNLFISVRRCTCFRRV